MGDRAQQNQELELWQVVSSSGNAQARHARARRAGTQTRSDMHKRGNVSGYNRTKTGNVRPAGTVRVERTRSSVTAGNVRVSRTGGARPTGEIKSEYAGSPGAIRSTGTVRSEYAGSPRAIRPSGGVRSEYARPPGGVRSADPRRVRTTPSHNTRAKTQAPKKKKTSRRAQISQVLALAWVVLMCAAIAFMGRVFYKNTQKSHVVKADKPVESSASTIVPIDDNTKWKPNIREDFLTISEYNRPGTKLASVNNIFVHYTANPKTSAAQNRSYFENLGQTHERAASAHFIIGYEGEIIQCIPLEEEAYAVVERNGDSVSIECCYLAEDGSFTQETYDSLVEMLAWLLDKYDLEPHDILRHYDCGGKLCPIYYVKHEDAWQKLLDDVANYTH